MSQLTKPVPNNIYHLDFPADQNTISRQKAAETCIKNSDQSHHTLPTILYQHMMQQILKAEESPNLGQT